MDLKTRLIAYIIKTAPVTMDTLIDVAKGKGFSETDILSALDGVHRDKRITQSSNSTGVVTYKLATAKERVDTGAWLRANYPWPGEGDIPSFEMPFPTIDMSWIVMSPDEAKEYKAQAKNMPTFMYNKTHGNHTRR